MSKLSELIARWDSQSPLGEVLRRVAGRVTVTDAGCWECGFRKDTSGYPQLSFHGKPKSAHRLTYEAAHGAIPSHLQIDHLCRNRACCNPAHLEAVTPRENGLRGDTIQARNAAATHCPQGHQYSSDNSYPSDLRLGRRRRCRTCHLSKEKQRKFQRSAA